MKSIAYFITSHGYGHAARATAIMAALHEMDASVRFEIFTTVPRSFFETSLGSPFGYHSMLTDVGLVQDTPTQENLPATLHALQEMYPLGTQMLKQLAATLSQLQCALVICDISPLGIAAARHAGIPSLLIENFRWDWIYENYQNLDKRFTEYIHYLRDLLESADHLIQTEPVCVRHAADLTLPPISRTPRTGRQETRARLGIPPESKTIYVSMGGSDWDTSFLQDLQEQSDHIFIISGGRSGGIMAPQRRGNILFLDVTMYMPDVLASCDAVISKAGYSTLAEVYYAGMPFGYITRRLFRESQVLEAFIRSQMQGIRINEADFYSGGFIRHIADLLSLPRIQRDRTSNGAQAAAQFILQLLGKIAK